MNNDIYSLDTEDKVELNFNGTVIRYTDTCVTMENKWTSYILAC